MEEKEEKSEENLMAEMLAESSSALLGLKNREIVWVPLVQRVAEGFLADIGEKREAFIPESDWEGGPLPPVGESVPVVLAREGRDQNWTILSFKEAKRHLAWQEVQRAFQSKEKVEGKVGSAVKGGLLVDIGVGAFLPASLVDLRPVRQLSQWVGRTVVCYVLEINEQKKQIVLSRKQVLAEEAEKKQKEALARLKPGVTLEGKVRSITDFGAFVELGQGLEGLVHVSDIAWRVPKKPQNFLRVGQRVQVKVLGIQGEAGKISLGMKQLTPNPIFELQKRFPKNKTASGQVKRVLKQGLRVQIDAKTMAFVPAEEIPEGREWKEGESLSGVVLGIHPNFFEVTLSVRKLEAIEERKRLSQYLKGAPPLTLGQIIRGGD